MSDAAKINGLEMAIEVALSLRDEADAGKWTDASGDAWTMGFGFAMNLIAKRLRSLLDRETSGLTTSANRSSPG
jgi:hypothetical protein